MNKLKIIIGIIVMTALDVWGNPCVKLGYTDENTDGFGDAGATVTPWISFPTDKTDIYAGNKITSVTIDINSKATNVYLYIRRDRTDSENLYRQKVGTLSSGRHEIQLDTPFELTCGNPVAIGYKATFSAAKGAAFGSPENDYASHVYYNTKNTWADIRGSFCISAAVEGDCLPSEELAAVSLSDGTKLLGKESTPLTLIVENLGTSAVTSFSVDFSVDGVNKGEIIFDTDINIPSGSKYAAILEIPSYGTGLHQIEVCIGKVNGVADAFSHNNTAKATVMEPDAAFVRRIVVEEGTAEWCSFCPRGIVGMEMMSEKYPDEFIGIAVHSSDSFSVASYAPALIPIPTLPGCTVNRHNSGDPYTDIERLISQALNEPSYVGYNITSSIADNIVTVHSAVAVEKPIDASTLNFAFSLTEDNLIGNQKNSYSGSTEPMGGWETLPQIVKNYSYNDVARLITPCYEGVPMLSGMLLPGETYEFDYSFELPDIISSTDNISVIGHVIDNTNGFVLNAHKVKPSTNSSLKEAIEAYVVLESEVYTSTGILLVKTSRAISSEILSTLPRGILIIRNITSKGVHAKKIFNL